LKPDVVKGTVQRDGSGSRWTVPLNAVGFAKMQSHGNSFSCYFRAFTAISIACILLYVLFLHNILGGNMTKNSIIPRVVQ
jgi:hypothetical protein